jgi:hypothetical protein
VYVVEGVGFHRLFSNVSMISHVKPSCEAAEAGNSQEAYFSNLKHTHEAAKRGRSCFQERTCISVEPEMILIQWRMIRVGCLECDVSR